MQTYRFIPRIPAAALVAGLALLAGCGGRPPAPADPGRAGAALRLALDAWKSGRPAESLRQGQPAVTVIDREWQGGLRLVDYQVRSEQPLGAELRCQVTLSLRDGRGKTVRKQAVYSVGTAPTVTVVREEDP